MPIAPLRRRSSLIMCAGFAIAGGLLGGATTVHGLRLNSYGNGPAASIRPQLADDSETEAACDECSDRSLGFRWATIRNIANPADCPDDSWNFRRGCVAYTRGSTL